MSIFDFFETATSIFISSLSSFFIWVDETYTYIQEYFRQNIVSAILYENDGNIKDLTFDFRDKKLVEPLDGLLEVEYFVGNKTYIIYTENTQDSMPFILYVDNLMKTSKIVKPNYIAAFVNIGCTSFDFSETLTKCSGPLGDFYENTPFAFKGVFLRQSMIIEEPFSITLITEDCSELEFSSSDLYKFFRI